MPTNRSPEEEMPLLVLNYVISSFEDFAACSDVVANERGGGSLELEPNVAKVTFNQINDYSVPPVKI